jgi:hypothetical protein
VSIPEPIQDGDTVTVRVTNPEDPHFGVLIGEKSITVTR